MSFRAGFARVDITPPMGTELAGYGPFLRRRATSVRNRLYARAAAFHDGADGWVVVSCDLLAVGERTATETVNAVVEQTGWPRRAIAVHATHTHSGPQTLDVNIGWGQLDPFYQVHLSRHIARACTEAIGDLQDSRIGHASVPVENFAHNRMRPQRKRQSTPEARWFWETDDPGIVDESMQVFRVDDLDGSFRGFLCHYACHPVVHGPYGTEVSGDFCGVALETIENNFDGAVGVFLQGALGDINPNYVPGPVEESEEALQEFGSRFGEYIEIGLKTAIQLDGVKLGSARGQAVCPSNSRQLRDFSSSSINAAALESFGRESALDRRGRIIRQLGAHALDSPPDLRNGIKTESDEAQFDAACAAVQAISLQYVHDHPERATDPIIAQCLVLGEFAFTGVNLELFHGLQRRHQRAMGKNQFLLSCTNGYLGYGPTRDAFTDEDNPYPAYVVPIILGRLPFSADIEDVISKLVEKVASEARSDTESKSC